MMGRSGGSLLKASYAVAADPGQAKYSQISYFAVAEKKSPRRLKKHELVTIVIPAESSSSSKGQNDLKKNVELQAEVAQFFKINFSKLALHGLPTPAAEPGMDLTGARTFHGEGGIGSQRLDHGAHHCRDPRRQAQRHPCPAGAQAH